MGYALGGKLEFYAIVNHRTSEAYVGVTNSPSTRYGMHFAALRRRNHHNQALQAAYDRNGDAAFGLLLLERWNFNGPDDGDRARYEQCAEGDREAFWMARARAAGIVLYNDQVGRGRRKRA